MTPFLILTRAAIVGWTRLAVFPLEMAFDVIEGELERAVHEQPKRKGTIFALEH
jgi:hypothetical protein